MTPMTPISPKEYWVSRRGQQVGHDTPSGDNIGKKGSYGSLGVILSFIRFSIKALTMTPTGHANDPNSSTPQQLNSSTPYYPDIMGPSPSVAVGGSAEPRHFAVWGIFEIWKTLWGILPPERYAQ